MGGCAYRRSFFLSRLWAYISDGADKTPRADGDPINEQPIFEFTTTREAIHPTRFLKDYRGHLQADDYNGYHATFRTGRVEHYLCWAHVPQAILQAARRFAVCARSALLHRRYLSIGERIDLAGAGCAKGCPARSAPASEAGSIACTRVRQGRDRCVRASWREFYGARAAPIGSFRRSVRILRIPACNIAQSGTASIPDSMGKRCSPG